jgi:hypothetical protein
MTNAIKTQMATLLQFADQQLVFSEEKAVAKEYYRKERCVLCAISSKNTQIKGVC